MIMTLEPPIAGLAPLCASCVHRWRDLSHPHPCTKYEWIGTKHHEPKLERRRQRRCDVRRLSVEGTTTHTHPHPPTAGPSPGRPALDGLVRGRSAKQS